MDSKKCFKCGEIKPLDEFYKHPQMGDGHLNKCKQCTKKDVKQKYLENSLCNDYMEKERERGREKYRKYKYKTCDLIRSKEKKFGLTFYYARKVLSRLFVIPAKTELHHWNYNLPYNVIVLTRRIHSRVHSKITLNLDEGIYYHNGIALDTLEKHLELVKSVCEEFGLDFDSVCCLSKE